MSIWGIIIGVMLSSFVIQQVLSAKFNRYKKTPLSSGMSGADVARRMLAEHGIFDVEIRRGSGFLTDYFDPSRKVVMLSPEVYDGRSIASAAVAAHECGHAVQHAEGYAPLKLRSALVPAVNFANMTVQWVLLAGILVMNVFPALLWAGIGLFALTTLFSFVTLPVEINASGRAIRWLDDSGIADDSTLPKAKDALRWAAYTYVVAAIGSLSTLIYYISIANNRR